MARSKRQRKRADQGSLDKQSVQLRLSLAPLMHFIGENWLPIRSGAVFLVSITMFISILAVSVDTINATLAVVMAQISNLVLRLLGAGTTIDGVIIRSSRFAVQVVAGCTGLQTMVIFIAAVLAYPSQLSQKLRGIMMGVSIIFLLNLVRVVTLFYIGMLAPQYFEVAHLLVWQYLIVASTAIILIAWVRTVDDTDLPRIAT